jgi:hypothetical protein
MTEDQAESQGVQEGKQEGRGPRRNLSLGLGLFVVEVFLFFVFAYLEAQATKDLWAMIVGALAIIVALEGLLWLFVKILGRASKIFLGLAVGALLAWAFWVGFYTGRLTLPGAQLTMNWLPTVTFPTPTTTPIIVGQHETPTSEPQLPSPTPYFEEDSFNNAEDLWEDDKDKYYVSEVITPKELKIGEGNLTFVFKCDLLSEEKSNLNTDYCLVPLDVPAQPREEFRLELEMEPASNTREDGIGGAGIVLRSVETGDEYFFLVLSDHTFLWVKNPADQDPYTLVEIEHMSEINTRKGQINTLEIEFGPDKVFVTLNGKQVGNQIEGNSLVGKTEFFLAAYTEGLNRVETKFLNLEITPIN